VDKYSYLANLEEIKENDYNLNIPLIIENGSKEKCGRNMVHSSYSKYPRSCQQNLEKVLILTTCVTCLELKYQKNQAAGLKILLIKLRTMRFIY